MDMR